MAKQTTHDASESTTTEPATCFARVETRIGLLLLVGERAGARISIRGIYFDGARHSAGAVPLGAHEDEAAFAEVHAQLDAYLDGKRTTFELGLAPLGTNFQRRVWRALAEIPYGTTTAYAAIARSIGKPRAVRAVGAAIGKNPISIVVPCHRVIGKNGTLTGYAGGLSNKRRLLEIESVRASTRCEARPKIGMATAATRVIRPL